MNKHFFYILAVALIFVTAITGCKKDKPTPVITITVQPAPTTTVTAGSITGSLTVEATVTEGATLAYQWYGNATAGNTGGTAVATGGTSATFAIPADLTAAGSPYYYYCVVSASGGAKPVSSNVATVTVNAAAAKVKLLEKMEKKYEWGSFNYEFEYDEQNRISEILRYSEGSLSSTIPITYSGNDLVEVGYVVENNLNTSYETFIYTKSGNAINYTMTRWSHNSGVSSITGTRTGVLTLNDDGLPVTKVEDYGGGRETTYEYDGNGNMVKWSYTYGINTEWREYEYDNNKSPILHCKSPKWWLLDYLSISLEVGFHNNITECVLWNGKETYAYVYDSDEYPTKATKKDEYDGEDEVGEYEITFTYIEK